MLPAPFRDSRIVTSRQSASYLGACGRWMFGAARTEVHRQIRRELRVATTPAERRRVMECWRRVHYLAQPAKGPHWDPIGRNQVRLSYYLDLPALRPEPVPWYPAAAVTIRFALPQGTAGLGLDSPLQALEIARAFVADDARQLPDFTPEVLREVIRRLRAGTDWQQVIAGRVRWRPLWVVSWSDPGVGHDGGLYRGAGAEFLGRLVGGKDLWGWKLAEGE